MKLTKLDIDLLKILINHREVTLEQIGQFLEISPVNARKSIFRLRDFLKENSLGELFNNKTIYTLQIYQNFFVNDETINEVDISSNERFYYILWNLTLKREINLSQLAEQFDLNRTSLNLDMKKIKNLLNKYNVKVKSLPWKGIDIDGDSINIHIFSIKLLFKFLLEKQFNQLSWDLYGFFINPFIKKSLDEYTYILKTELKNIEEIKIKIADTLNITIGTYAYTYIEAVLLYLIIFDKNIHTNDLPLIYLENFSKLLQNKFFQVSNNLSKINDLSTHKKIKDKINLLALFIINLDSNFFENIIDTKIIHIKEYLEKTYKITLSTDDLIMLNTLFKIFSYKYDFDVKGFNNYFLEKIELPKKFISDAKNILKKVDINILNEDYYVIALHLYQLIYDKIEKEPCNIKIIIIDSSINNWVGKGFKAEVLKYVPSMKIEISTIYKMQNINFDNYDYILFTHFIDKELLLKNNPKYINKIYSINYTSYFQVNNFLDILFFRKYSPEYSL